MTILEQRAYEAIAKMAHKDEPDYWEKLKHQYAGMAMQGLCANSEWNDSSWEIIAEDAINAATALVEKLKKSDI